MFDDTKFNEVVDALPLWLRVILGVLIVAAGFNALYDLGHLLGSFFAQP